MNHFKWAWNNMGPKKPLFIVGLIISAATCVAMLVNPMIAQRLIDDVIVPKNTAPLLPLLGILFAVQLTRLIMRYIMIVIMEVNSIAFLNSIRRHLYDALQNAGLEFLRRFPTGNLMTRMTSDLERLRHTASWVIYQIVDSITIFVSAIAFLLFVHWQLALLLAAVTPLILVVSQLFVKRIRSRFVLLRQKLTSLSQTVSENIDGNRVVKAFAREDYEIDKFEKHNADFRDTSVENALIAARYQPALEAFSQALAVITLLAGGIFLIRGQMTAGQYLAFSSYIWALSNPLRMLGMLLSDMEAFNASSAMIEEIYEPENKITEPEVIAAEPPSIFGSIEFRNVCYEIDGMKVLDGITFNVKPGDTLGILGSTGSGKTSAVNMLPRFIEPTSGEVLIDGRNVRDYPLAKLRSSIGFAMQDVFLFSDSVSANIAYGIENLPETDAARRAKDACAADFIGKLSDGYETLVGERGVGLSGGQKQRLSLARALAVRPAVLILDDTTSAVDSETEQEIQQNLRALDFPCTKIIIAQRLSSFRGAKEIIVMDKGRIIERGTHDSLLQNGGYYKMIWDLQMGAAEK